MSVWFRCCTVRCALFGLYEHGCDDCFVLLAFLVAFSGYSRLLVNGLGLIYYYHLLLLLKLPMAHPRSGFLISGPRKAPAVEIFAWLPVGVISAKPARGSLGLVDSSRVHMGAFFREVHPGSEMASQNDQNKAKWERKLSNHDEP